MMLVVTFTFQRKIGFSSFAVPINKGLKSFPSTKQSYSSKLIAYSLRRMFKDNQDLLFTSDISI